MINPDEIDELLSAGLAPIWPAVLRVLRAGTHDLPVARARLDDAITTLLERWGYDDGSE
jgi:hypothetical protein